MDNPDNKIRIDGGLGTSRGYSSMEEVLAAAKETSNIVIENGEDISDLVPKPESVAQVYARFNGSALRNAAMRGRKPTE